MNQDNLSVLFFLKKEKTNKQGICPIYCRITYSKKRKQFSTGEFVNPTDWNPKHQKAGSKTIANQQINLNGNNTQAPYIIVEKIDEQYEKAVAAGAKILIEIKDEEYGGRGYTCKDTEEYIWNFGSYDPWMENE